MSREADVAGSAGVGVVKGDNRMGTAVTQEIKISRHRAVVLFKNGKEGHLLMGTSYGAVHDGYDEAFHALYGHKSEQNQTDQIREVQIQKWDGQPDAGRWTPVKTVKVPQEVSLPVAIRRKETPAPTP